jgi:two-component system chemotaxis response regulator CheB
MDRSGGQERKMVRVLVVEDSPVVREFLLHVLGSDPEIEVVGTAETGEEALEAVERMRPDIITMDVHMPRMDGFETTRRIMETRPTPIVIVSGTLDVAETTSVFRAIEAGALAVMPRPSGIDHPEHQRSAADFAQTIKLMAEVKVVRRWRHPRPEQTPPMASPCAEVQPGTAPTETRLIAIGASTGGPPVLRVILSGLPKDFAPPVLIVQHIATGFTQGFAEWLAQSSSLPVQLSVHGQQVVPGRVYVAPDGFHMTAAGDGRVWLNTDEPENGLRPSVSCLFRSVAKAYGQSAIGVLLTGMGKDGAWELKLMKDQGAVTIAQDNETSVVHGMPGEAIRLGGATYVLPPEKISRVLTSLVARVSSQLDTDSVRA